MRYDSAQARGHDAARAMYRLRAYSYDLQLAPYEFIRRHAIERLQLQPGQCVLDLGCGTGMSLALLRQAVGPQGRVVAVDQCPEMVALARSRVQVEGWHNVELLCTEVEAAPLPAQADAAFFHLVHDILQSPQAVAHVLSHLKPGARIVATGLKWTAPWLLPWNALVGLFAAQSITNFDRLATPWQPLLDQGVELEVETVLMGTIFVASGVVGKRVVKA
jgi:SAM-dependent methyltransferase